MDFSLSKSQQMLVKSVRDYLNKECQDLAREAEKMESGFSESKWQNIADLGWLGIGIPETDGGMDGDGFDRVLVLEEMGRHLFPGPFIASTICVSSLLQEFGTAAQKKEFLQPMIDGELIVAPALIKPDEWAVAGDYSDRIQSQDSSGDLTFSGIRLLVPYAAAADYFLVYIEADHQLGRPCRFYLVKAEDAGIRTTVLPTIAEDRQCEVIFEEVEITAEHRLGNDESSDAMLIRIQDWGALAHSAYLMGILERVVEMTVAYAKQRVQFDKPIGQFQAIQHQCANMKMDLDQVRYLTWQAAWKISEGLPARKEIAMAKAKASDASQSIGLLGIKIHGGSGIIDEYDMQLYFRRAKAMELSFGDADIQREIIAVEMGL